MAEATKWQTYEGVAMHIMNAAAERFGLARVEGKQTIQGTDGANWEIDAKGITVDDGIVIIECKRYPDAHVNQGQAGLLAYLIARLGAEGGFIVSPLDLQAGAKQVASSNNIKHISLNADSTAEDFVLQFLGKKLIGKSISVTQATVPSVTISHPR